MTMTSQRQGCLIIHVMGDQQPEDGLLNALV